MPRVYQAFRWWGVGTVPASGKQAIWSLSSIPMVGCRNSWSCLRARRRESIKHSDGGVSEHHAWTTNSTLRVYQAFRWWGVGTHGGQHVHIERSLSSIPMVGCRNAHGYRPCLRCESIKHSDGGVSEPWPQPATTPPRVYQAFRWWGVGTLRHAGVHHRQSLSSIPMVGCRNRHRWLDPPRQESIKHSDGGVSEPLPRVAVTFR